MLIGRDVRLTLSTGDREIIVYERTCPTQISAHETVYMQPRDYFLLITKFDTGIGSKGLKLVYWRSFELNRQWSYRGSSFYVGWMRGSLSLSLSIWLYGRTGLDTSPWLLRLVGFTRFVFHVLELLLSIITLRNVWCISKLSTTKHQHKLNWKSGHAWFDYHHWKCIFVAPMNKYIRPPICVHCWVWNSQTYLKS